MYNCMFRLSHKFSTHTTWRATLKNTLTYQLVTLSHIKHSIVQHTDGPHSTEALLCMQAMGKLEKSSVEKREMGLSGLHMVKVMDTVDTVKRDRRLTKQSYQYKNTQLLEVHLH